MDVRVIMKDKTTNELLYELDLGLETMQRELYPATGETEKLLVATMTYLRDIVKILEERDKDDVI